MLRFANYINGALVAPAGDAYLDAFNPATGQAYAHVPDSDERDVEAAVQAALAAFKTWSKTPREDRAATLRRIADCIERRLDEFAQAESLDQGKTVKLAREIEIPRAVHNFRAFADAIMTETSMASQMERAGCINYTIHTPVGVAGLISPWNLPLYLLTWKIAPAVAYGCTCVAKPSEFTSYTAHLLASVFTEAKLPAGVVNIVFGTGPRAGQALVAHPRVPIISFTGGTVTAERIIKASAPFYKKLSLELGGKNAGIVFEDAILDQAIPTIVRSAFQNQGEICLCTSRLFVHAKVFDIFVRRYVEAVRALRVGNPCDPSTDMGPLVSKEHRAKVLSYIDLARELGGQIHCGGGPVDPATLPGECKDGYFVQPTVITGLWPDSRVCQEEIFGPVVTIVPFETEEQVIKYANDIQYGLAASVWTENLGRMHRVAQALDVGTVWCNCWMIRQLSMPFGGQKASGVGREGTTGQSREVFTEEKVVCIKISN